MLFRVLALACLGLAFSFEEETSNPLQDLKNYVDSLDQYDDHEWKHECHLSGTESCDLSTFPKDETTMVFPGGETRCIFSNTPEFAFQVVPGATDKVLFYFQGGGACWDETSTKLHLCRSRATPLWQIGVFDRDNRKNKFRDFTIVNVLYCSGDVHGGNTVRPYNDRWGQPVQQKGIANAQAVLDWTAAQQAKGTFASTLSELVVMGCSAGSIGAQLWGKQVVSTLKWKKASVVPDSYAGIFPEGSIGPLVNGFGFCTSGFLSPELQKKCDDQTITIQDMDLEFMAATPTVPYAFIQSKIDVVQRTFYRSVAFTGNYTGKMSPEIFYNNVSTLFGSYNQHAKNFIVYLVDGHNHCYTPRETFYITDPVSPWDRGQNGSPMLHDWAAAFPLAEGESQSTVCTGPVTTVAANGVGLPQFPGNNTNYYCSSAIVGKSFVEQY